MFKTIKDAKRRVVESVLEGVGKSEKTVDEEFDLFVSKYQTMLTDMNECGAGLHTVLAKQKEFLRDNCEISNSVARINATNNDSEYWPGASNCLTSVQAAMQNKESASYIHNVVRSSAALVSVERGLEPLREAIAALTPEIDALIKERNLQVTDYDSYRRRVKTAREKKESLEAQNKTGTPAYTDAIADLNKLEAKEQTAKEGYEFKNKNTKQKILDARVQHDILLNELLLNLVVAQHEMFSRAAVELENVVAKLPQEKVAEARGRISALIQQGGNRPEAPKEKTTLQKSLLIATGKAVPSDFKGAAAEPVAARASVTPPPPTAVAVPVGSTTKSPTNSSSNPFGAASPPPPTSAVPPPPPAGVPPPPPAPDAPAKKAYIVEALFDIEAEAEDELTFKAGDQIEVLETSDDGWWKGSVHGKVGLFPVNYVRT